MREVRLVLVGLIALACAVLPTGAEADESAPLRVVGSGTLRVLLQAWDSALSEQSPATALDISGGGSSKGPHALLTGAADVASMSRPMNRVEESAFREHFGRDPLAIAVAADAIAVFVHPDNPIEGLTLAQLDGIFGKRRSCSEGPLLRTWGSVGLDGVWSSRTISRFGHSPASGTREMFERVALCGGRQAPDVRQRPGKRSTMLSVAESRYAIAYSSVIDLAAGVRAIPIAGAEGGPGVLPTRAEVSAGRYPLGRRLWLYTLTSETGELDPRVDRLLRFALSDAGQSIAESRGYWQLPPERRRRQLEALPAP